MLRNWNTGAGTLRKGGALRTIAAGRFHLQHLGAESAAILPASDVVSRKG